MKYSDLISFHPIEDVIQLVTAENKDKAREYVKTYVMSDTMAESLQAPVLDQLQMDEVVDNKGVLIVGNYGTGKSHLMSVLSAIATDADNVQYLQNKKFAEQVMFSNLNVEPNELFGIKGIGTLLTDKEQTLINNYRALDDAGKEALEIFANAMAEKAYIKE